MSFLQAPEYMKEISEWCRRIARVTNQSMQGKTNNTGSVTLTANAASTTVTEAPNKIGDSTVILFMPTTANAVAAMTNVYVSSRSVSNNTFTITHANTATIDRTFNYILVG
jgi:hypothetical protein